MAEYNKSRTDTNTSLGTQSIEYAHYQNPAKMLWARSCLVQNPTNEIIPILKTPERSASDITNLRKDSHGNPIRPGGKQHCVEFKEKGLENVYQGLINY